MDDHFTDLLFGLGIIANLVLVIEAFKVLAMMHLANYGAPNVRHYW